MVLSLCVFFFNFFRRSCSALWKFHYVAGGWCYRFIVFLVDVFFYILFFKFFSGIEMGKRVLILIKALARKSNRFDFPKTKNKKLWLKVKFYSHEIVRRTVCIGDAAAAVAVIVADIERI